MFSKSFGYALRGILYIAMMQEEGRRVQVDEVSSELKIPKHFMGKILKNLVKHKLLGSTKGPYGGFYLREHTMSASILDILKATDGMGLFLDCSLSLHQCNNEHPCPLHDQITVIRANLQARLETTTVKDLVLGNKRELIKSISTFIHQESPKPLQL